MISACGVKGSLDTELSLGPELELWYGDGVAVVVQAIDEGWWWNGWAGGGVVGWVVGWVGGWGDLWLGRWVGRWIVSG